MILGVVLFMVLLLYVDEFYLFIRVSRIIHTVGEINLLDTIEDHVTWRKGLSIPNYNLHPFYR